jgi:ribosome-associated protein
MIKITEQLYISENELKFTASRSGGPGGQHVNKVSTRITLSFDVINSHALSDDQKQLILRRLATRINRQGILQIAGQEHRSQTSNRNAAIERFVELMRKALKRKVIRQQTKIPKGAVESRIRVKKLRGRLKRQRKMDKEELS